MVILKVIRHSNGNLDYLRNMVRYVTDSRAVSYGGFGVDISNPENAYAQMLAVRRYYNQTSTNSVIHLVISFDGKYDDAFYASQVAPMIAAYFKDCYQLLWCVHCADAYDSHYHMHILLHSVNLMNGNLFHSGPYEINEFGYHIKNITGRPFQVYYECMT